MPYPFGEIRHRILFRTSLGKRRDHRSDRRHDGPEALAVDHHCGLHAERVSKSESSAITRSFARASCGVARFMDTGMSQKREVCLTGYFPPGFRRSSPDLLIFNPASV
jgi:hypothetical protein